MKLYVKIGIALLLSTPLLGDSAFAQDKASINWISFNQLNDSLQLHPKKVFVNFYADWCTLCKQMEQLTFTDEDVIKELTQNYYAVKMNIESADTIIFGEQTFVNKRLKKVNPIHQIALLMASRKNQPFSLPAFVLLNNQFIAEKRYFQYMDANAMLKVLQNL